MADFEGDALALWSHVNEEWELDEVATAVLREACTTLEEIGEMKEALSRAGYLVPAAHGAAEGAEKVNPLVAAIRQHRAALSRLLRELGLEDDAVRQSGKRPDEKEQWREAERILEETRARGSQDPA